MFWDRLDPIPSVNSKYFIYYLKSPSDYFFKNPTVNESLKTFILQYHSKQVNKFKFRKSLILLTRFDMFSFVFQHKSDFYWISLYKMQIFKLGMLSLVFQHKSDFYWISLYKMKIIVFTECVR